MWMLLHGFTGAPESWDPLVAGSGFDRAPLCPALMGHGRDWREREVESFAAEVGRLCALASTEPPPRFLAGYSLGARVAAALLTTAPELFQGAVLVGVHPGLKDEGERLERLRADEARARKLRAEGVAAFVSEWEQQPLFASQRALPEGVRAKQREIRLEHDAEGLARSLETLGLGSMPSLADALSASAARVAVMAGGEDSKFRRLATELAARSTHIEPSIVEGAGHNLLLEAPDHVVAAMVDVARRAQEGASA